MFNLVMLVIPDCWYGAQNTKCTLIINSSGTWSYKVEKRNLFLH